MVKALKNFQGLPEEGGFIFRGIDFEVGGHTPAERETRHRELAKNGLVTPPEEDQKQAPTHQNKMVPEAPNNKMNLTNDALRRVQPLPVKLDDPKAADKIVEQHTPLAGGPTPGADNAPSSSGQGRQRRGNRLRPSGAKQK